MSSTTKAEKPRLATQDDLLRAIIALECLPKRPSENVTVELRVYQIALEGDVPRVVVAAVDLAVAIRRIIQGVLGHGFHPSPSELRMVCDKVRDERCQDLDRQSRQRRIKEEAASLNSARPTPEQKRRLAAIYEKFCREWDDKDGDKAAELEAIRAKYDPKVLAALPDRPIAETWKHSPRGGR